MDMLEAMEARHAVRSYTERPIEDEVLARLQTEVETCNAESGLHMQLVVDEPRAFSGMVAHYGSFRNVRNYLAIVGPAGDEADERAGYFGQRVVLLARELGLDSCWVALTFKKSQARRHVDIGEGERLIIVVALGYGTTHGKSHTNKPIGKLCQASGDVPAWFDRGMSAALLAPTALNQQSFMVGLVGPAEASIRSKGGPCSMIDLGIVRYQFEQGAGPGSFAWV